MCEREAVDHLERPMSDYDLKADIGGRVRNVRFLPRLFSNSGVGGPKSYKIGLSGTPLENSL